MGADGAGLQSKWKAREITFRFVPNIERKAPAWMWQRPARLALFGRFQRLTRQGTEEENRADRDGFSLRHGRAKGRQKTRRPRGAQAGGSKCLARRRLEDRDRQGSIQTAHGCAV